MSAITSGVVSKEQLTRIVESVRRAPTGENCQPWTFQWNGERLDIFHDPDRARNRINYDSYVSYFSLGFLFENIRIAASKEGLLAKFKWMPILEQGSSHCGEVTFEPTSQPADELYATLEKRFTDRRPFKKGSMTDEVFSLVKRDAESFDNCRLLIKDQPTEEFLHYAQRAESFFWTNEPFHKDYTRWLRLTKREADETRDGLPWRSLGVNYPTSRLLLVCKPYKVQSFANKIGFLSIAKKVVTQQIHSSAAICCITIPASTKENLVEAGELGMRAWLRLNQHGYGFHPMSLSALITHYYVLGVTEQIHPGMTDIGREGATALKNYFGYGADEIPIWMFRTGVSAGFPEHHLTRRFETAELLKFVDGN